QGTAAVFQTGIRGARDRRGLPRPGVVRKREVDDVTRGDRGSPDCDERASSVARHDLDGDRIVSVTEGRARATIGARNLPIVLDGDVAVTGGAGKLGGDAVLSDSVLHVD